jgi:hypothetical protein
LLRRDLPAHSQRPPSGEREGSARARRSATQDDLFDQRGADPFPEVIEHIMNSPMSTGLAPTIHADGPDAMMPGGEWPESQGVHRIDGASQGPSRGGTGLRPNSRRSPNPSASGEGSIEGSKESGYVLVFERLFRMFRQKLFDCVGKRSEAMVAEAVENAGLNGEVFDPAELSTHNAHLVLNVIEEVTSEAPFLKRPKLRQAALSLISELYNKHFTLLEEHRTIESVEQVYYRLKA